MQRAICDQLNVVQPDKAYRSLVQAGQSRRNVHDRFTKSFPNSPAPTHVKGTLDHGSHIGRRCTRQPKWVWRLYSCKVSTQISHKCLLPQTYLSGSMFRVVPTIMPLTPQRYWQVIWSV